jgi:hypothetical protein
MCYYLHVIDSVGRGVEEEGLPHRIFLLFVRVDGIVLIILGLLVSPV